MVASARTYYRERDLHACRYSDDDALICHRTGNGIGTGGTSSVGNASDGT